MRQSGSVVRSVSFVFAMTFYAFAGVADTLKVVQEYDSPIRHPTAIEWDGYNFWLAGIGDSHIYKLDGTMTVLDSFDTRHSRVTAICFRGKELWFAVDTAVGVSAVNGGNVFRIYHLSLESGGIVDSLSFPGSYDTGLVYGLCHYDHSFSVSINAGWSSGLYRILTSPESLTPMAYFPLSGLTIINQAIWGIHGYGSIVNIQKGNSSLLHIPFPGTDLAYDGSNVFICNSRDSKIVEMYTPESYFSPWPQSLKEHLAGGWSWVSTSGGFSGQTFTPVSEHYSMTLLFTKDNPTLPDGSIGYRVYRNDTMVLSGVASIPLQFYPKCNIGMEPFGPQNCIQNVKIYRITDTLVLTDGYIDGYTSLFVRQQTVPVMSHPGIPSGLRSSIKTAGASDRFTILGRRLNPRQNAEPVFSPQLIVSPSKAGVAGMRKR